MDDARLEQLLSIRGPAFPPVANALAKLDDKHPLKQAVDMQASVSTPSGPTQEERLADLEARVAALETKP